jgi:hypothetical protein
MSFKVLYTEVLKRLSLKYNCYISRFEVLCVYDWQHWTNLHLISHGSVIGSFTTSDVSLISESPRKTGWSDLHEPAALALSQSQHRCDRLYEKTYKSTDISTQLSPPPLAEGDDVIYFTVLQDVQISFWYLANARGVQESACRPCVRWEKNIIHTWIYSDITINQCLVNLNFSLHSIFLSFI